MREDVVSRRVDSGRRGIALVVVLGLLVVLTILAFAFAVSMRTERMASNSFLHAAKARDFVRAGLARAMNDIDSAMLSSNLFYPPDSLSSTGGADGPRPALLTNEAAWMVPFAARPPEDVANGVTWTNLTDPDTGAIIGRYAYLAINVSGYLDPNVIGALPRAAGTNGAEIVIEPTHFLPEIADPAAFVAARSNEWIRFETLPELWHVSGFQTNADPQHLFPFSRFPSGYLSNNVAATPFLLKQNAADYDLAALAEAFRAAGAEDAAIGGDAATTATNWIDYLDEDFIPGGIDGGGATDGPNCDSFCTEPVPMLNEIVLSMRKEEVAASNWVITVDVQVELWYPFAGNTNSNAYTIRIEPGFVGGGYPTNPPALAVTTSSDWPGGSPLRVYAASFSSSAAGETVADPGTVAFHEFSVHDPSGRTIDRIAPPFEVPWMEGTRAWQAVDSRINWRWDADWVSAGETNSLGAVNPPAEAAYLAPGRDGSPAMYVRNGPGLANAGEIGFLLFSADRPWQTIRLLKPDALRVLDVFAMSTNTARGLVNPNSRDTNAIASAAFDAPAERWPGEPVARVDVAGAQAFAQQVFAARPYTNRSDLMKIDEAALCTALALDPAQAEGLVRNTAGLLCPRQNLFVILVAAQSVSDKIAPGTVSDFEIMSEARAAVVVWRDPYLSSNLVNRAFVRLFKWME